jgi:hypothetical protein
MRLITLLSGLLLSVSSQAAGVEAIQLDYVPLDASLKCDRIFFRSTQHFKGTVYALPRIMTDTDDIYEDIVRIEKNPKNIAGKPYQLSFRVYFPRDDEEIKEKTAMDKAPKFKSCNFEAVKYFLNQINPENPIHTIASMPLTSFEVSIDDFISDVASSKRQVGRSSSDGDVDIIDYQGKSYNFSFDITENEQKALLHAVQTGEGLQARVRFQFQARKRDGSLSVKIDTAKLAANFEAKANGKYGKMVKADVAATLKMAIDSTQLSIDSQSSSSEDFNKIADKIIEKVLAEINFSVSAITSDPKTSEPADAGQDEISIKVVADIIRQKVSQNIEYNNVKAAETASAESVIQLEASALDPSISQMRIAAGDGDTSLNEPLYAGQTVKISPAYQSLMYIEYREKVSYLSVEQLKSDTYSSFFQQLLTDGRYTIVNQERNGQLVAVATPSLMSSPQDYFMTEYLWRRVEKVPIIARYPRVTMGNNLEDFDRFPITVAFTNVGNQRKRFKFSELLTPNENWDAHYDGNEGVIVLTAKKDLGLLVLKQRFLLYEGNNDSLADEEDKDDSDFVREKITTEAIVKEKRNSWGWGDIEDSEPLKVRINTKATTKKRIVFFNVTKPSYSTKAGSEE